MIDATAARGFTLFDTAIGQCGVVWHAHALVWVQLPESNPAATRSRVERRFPGASEAPPPRFASRAIEDIVALLDGEPRDLGGIPLDMEGVPEFHQRVYAVARTIPPGQTSTYGEIAARLGEPGTARAVGQALGRNPFAIVVPCHRVLAADGGIGGFSAGGGVATKRQMLRIEGAPAVAGVHQPLRLFE